MVETASTYGTIDTVVLDFNEGASHHDATMRLITNSNQQDTTNLNMELI